MTDYSFFQQREKQTKKMINISCQISANESNFMFWPDFVTPVTVEQTEFKSESLACCDYSTIASTRDIASQLHEFASLSPPLIRRLATTFAFQIQLNRYFSTLKAKQKIYEPGTSAEYASDALGSAGTRPPQNSKWILFEKAQY